MTQEVLSKRTNDYQAWVEAFARNHDIPLEWAEKHVRKEDYVRPALRRMEREDRNGVYFILKSMEQGSTFRSTPPKVPHGGSQLPDSSQAPQPIQPLLFLLFLPSGRGPGSHGNAGRLVLPLPDHYYLNGHSFLEQQ